MRELKKDKLTVKIYGSRREMGMAAAEYAKNAINKAIEEKGFANVIFAAAPSQNETLEELLKQNIDFSKVNAFHMDEYAGLSLKDSQSFGRYLTDHIFGKANFKSVNLIPATEDIDVACEKYSKLLTEYPVDVVCLGIGENGHIAFNDPGVADFNDTKLIKKAKLDDVCRMQQVHDGCFESFDKVPEYALTLTVPALFKAKTLVCTVPAKTKAEAVKRTVTEDISENCPATVMRKHDDAVMFVETESASLL